MAESITSKISVKCDKTANIDLKFTPCSIILGTVTFLYTGRGVGACYSLCAVHLCTVHKEC